MDKEPGARRPGGGGAGQPAAGLRAE
ncbi:hypothetical protein E2C01_082227 [Portunus trituberculatus]|uniref:Uncharacterized protein n=1 Tax=Portunus trituberculatus TaxID=210409 RepID=A0A5B7J089_PORTR|nr:hypothetical protein [Portunus trituberculatus]